MKLSRVVFVCGLLLALAWSSGWCGESSLTAGAPVLSTAKEAGRDGALHAIRHILGWKLVITAVVATAVGCVGLMLLAAALVPGQVARAEQALRRGPWRVICIGIVSVLLLLFAATVLDKAKQAGAPALGLLAGAVLGFFVWLAAVGLSATAKIAGQRLLKDDEGTQPPWRTVGAGALAIAAAALVPAFGQALFLFLLCRGVGAATLALFPAPGGVPPPAAGEAQE
ncbi:MAG TPA: hypothetical protein VNE39_03530 [Planctomycetota bacterium]|nr:hypothetical protein [Planctomycetota bacterium]